MADSTEELEPLFDYKRVQPIGFVFLDDDKVDTPPVPSPKRRETSGLLVEEVNEDVKVIETVNCKDKDDDDWLRPPPKPSVDLEKLLAEDSTIKELRLRKRELESLAKSAKDMSQAVEECAKRKLSGSPQASLDAVTEQPSEPLCKRAKVVISFQDKDGHKQFRVYKDEKFERIFKLYADKVKLDIASLVFSFDGDKINLTATPDCLGMEDDDIIEVNMKKS